MARDSTRFPKPVGRCAQCVNRGGGAFRGLNSSALSCVDRGRRTNRYRPGQNLYSEGNSPLAVYCIQSGLVKLYLVDGGGGEHVVGLAGVGRLLGAGNVLAGLPYGETAEAVEPTQVCVIDKANLRMMLRADPSLWESLTEALCVHSMRVQRGLLRRAHCSARAKLSEILLDLHELTRGRGGEPLPFSRQDLAEMVGITQETTIRLLSEFRRRRLISLEGRRLSIQRPDVLRGLVGKEP